jgi:hypothetical protein
VVQLSPPCSACGARAATVELFEDADGWRLNFVGVANSGNSGCDQIPEDKAQAIREALTPPYDPAKVAAAGFYDDFGYCTPCERFYCGTHWQVSSTGGGTCPAGHFKSLDPHWRPEGDGF